jgi:hypothetical protein
VFQKNCKNLHYPRQCLAAMPFDNFSPGFDACISQGIWFD